MSNPGGGSATSRLTRAAASGRSNRSLSRSPRTTTSLTPKRRAIGARVAGSNRLCWIWRSSAPRRFTVPAPPAGRTSLAMVGRSIRPGRMGSTVFPQSYAAKLIPGISRTRPSDGDASRSDARAVQYAGTCSGRSKSELRNPCFKTGLIAMATMTSTTAAPIRRLVPARWSRPMPRTTATARTRTGTTLGVLRNASPNELESANVRHTRPYALGASSGATPAPMTVALTMSAANKARPRTRTRISTATANAGRAIVASRTAMLSV